MKGLEDVVGERLGEPVAAAALILPEGGWNSSGWGQLGRRLWRRMRGRPTSTVALGSHDVIAVTADRVVCLGARFERGAGLVPGDSLAELPRSGLEVEAERLDAVSYGSDAAGDNGRTHSKRIHRLDLASGAQRLRG